MLVLPLATVWARGQDPTTTPTILLEVAISGPRPELLDLIAAWTTANQSMRVATGPGVAEALSRALDVRHRLERGALAELDFQDQAASAEVLYGVCRLLLDDCPPQSAFDTAVSAWQLLAASKWSDDELEEHEELLCSLAFVAWRAARALGFWEETQHWETAYKNTFFQSLQWEVVKERWTTEDLYDAAEETSSTGPELIFQTLLHLEREGDAMPDTVMRGATALYFSLDSKREGASDLFSYLLGEAARIVGSTARLVGHLHESERWFGVAETHFRSRIESRPQLARVSFGRLALLYTLSRLDQVCREAPTLDKAFSDLGMTEDRVKGRILWAMTLKLLGRVQEAAETLEPVTLWSSRIRPALYGWVLLQSGDIQRLTGNYERALEELTQAADLLRRGRQFTGLADVNVILSGLYRAHGRLNEALALIESSRQEQERLGMKWTEAFTRMLLAETYLAMDRPREAEREIRAALPVLEEAGTIPDAVAGISLLREAVRRQRADQNGLSQISPNPWPKN